MSFMRLVGFVLVVAILTWTAAAQAEDRLMVFCGAAFKQPIEEISKAFASRTKVNVQVSYGGVGTLLAQISLTKKGDLFVGPSVYAMEQARTKGLLATSPAEPIAYFVPAINVQKGNPKNIKGLQDLTRPSLKVAIANPEVVFAGMVAAEIVEKAFNAEQLAAFRRNVVAYPIDANRLAMALTFKNVDAIIGLHNMSDLYPEKIDTIKLKASEVQRIGAGQAAVLAHAENISLAERFKSFMVSKESREIFAKYHYLGTAEEAFAWIGAKKPIGGERPASAYWFKN